MADPYRERGGAWRHPGRTAVFVGDLVDRGPGQAEAVGMAHRMVEAGSARIVMGNHELNSIAWATQAHDDRDFGQHTGDAGRPASGSAGG